MLSKKIKLIVFVSFVAIVALAASSVFAIISIKEAKNENEVAKGKIVELNELISSLVANLEKTHSEMTQYEDRLEKYQEIFTAWTNATPQVNEAVNSITSAYKDVLENSHLFPNGTLSQMEDEMLDAVYAVIRSTNPSSIAKEFLEKIEKTNEKRYDNVMRAMIEKIKTNGITFPEDEKAVTELRNYFEGFADDVAIIDSLRSQGLENELIALEALLDKDEENDLAGEFEKAVADIKAPITLQTSLDAAITSWEAFYMSLEPKDELDPSTSQARALLDSFLARKTQLELAKEAADEINNDVDSLKIAPDLKTGEIIALLEQDILNWIDVFDIDEANMYLVRDISTVKKAYENALTELNALYEAFKLSVEKIGKIDSNSKANIDAAFEAYELIKDFKDTDAVLALSTPNTVSELYAILLSCLDDYNYLSSLIDTIRAEIDRLYEADPNVTHNEISALNVIIDELLALDIGIDSLNTDSTDYVELLNKTRLLPRKNDAFNAINSSYLAHYEMANGDRATIIALVEIKDIALNCIENATNEEEIEAYVSIANAAFAKCLEKEN